MKLVSSSNALMLLFFHQENVAVIQVSYKVTLKIAKRKKLHSIKETLMKQCLLKTVKLVLMDVGMVKVTQISLSINTIKRHIGILEDIIVQVISEIKASPMFLFQVDETTDVKLICSAACFCQVHQFQ